MDQERIGKFIAESRLREGLTQKQLSAQLGVSDRTISKWENGKSMPDISFLPDICDLLHITMNELISGEQLPEEAYHEKAEETIMNLVKENRILQKKDILRIVLGLLVMGIVIVFAVGSPNLGMLSNNLFDVPTLLILVGLTAGMLLITRTRTLSDVLQIMEKTALPIAVLTLLINLFLAFGSITVGTANDPLKEADPEWLNEQVQEQRQAWIAEHPDATEEEIDAQDFSVSWDQVPEEHKVVYSSDPADSLPMLYALLDVSLLPGIYGCIEYLIVFALRWGLLRKQSE